MPHATLEARRSYNRAYRERYLSDPANRERIRTVQRERATAIRRFIDSVKMDRGCIDCGYSGHPAALDFDHVTGPKSHLVSGSKSIAQAKREIAKCEVRCANCHRVATWARRWGQAVEA